MSLTHYWTFSRVSGRGDILYIDLSLLHFENRVRNRLDLSTVYDTKREGKLTGISKGHVSNSVSLPVLYTKVYGFYTASDVSRAAWIVYYE